MRLSMLNLTGWLLSFFHIIIHFASNHWWETLHMLFTLKRWKATRGDFVQYIVTTAVWSYYLFFDLNKCAQLVTDIIAHTIWFFDNFCLFKVEQLSWVLKEVQITVQFNSLFISFNYEKKIKHVQIIYCVSWLIFHLHICDWIWRFKF